MTFNEYIVKRKKTSGRIVVTILLYLVATVLAFFCIALLFMLPQVAALLGFGCYYLAYKIATGLDKEFEYIFTADTITVDLIMNASRRKRLLSFNVSQLEILAPVKHSSYQRYKDKSYNKITDATSRGDILEVYYAVYNDEDRRYMLLFEPPYSFLEEYYRYAPSKITLDA